MHGVVADSRSCAGYCRAKDGCTESEKTTSAASFYAKEAEKCQKTAKESVGEENIPTRGEYHSLILEMRLGDHESFYRYFHMTPQRFSHLLSLVGLSITRSDTTFRCAISPGERLAIMLRFLVTGDSMQTISFSYRVDHSTVCGIVYSTCESLWNELLPQYMQKPSSPAEWERISQDFEHTWIFPHCVGAHCCASPTKIWLNFL